MLAGRNGRKATARNTSWGGSASTSWGGSSSTSWGGSSSTSWGGTALRGRAGIAGLALILPVLAALPFAGRALDTTRVVVVGTHATQALHGVGAKNVTALIG